MITLHPLRAASALPWCSNTEYKDLYCYHSALLVMLAWVVMVLALQMGGGEVRAVWHMGYWDQHYQLDQALPVVGPRLARSEYQKPQPRFVFGLGKRSGRLGREGDDAGGNYKDWAEVSQQLEMIVAGLKMRMINRDG